MTARLHFGVEGDWLRVDGPGYELVPACGYDFHGRKKLAEDYREVTCPTCRKLCGLSAEGIEPARHVLTERARLGRAA